MQVSEVMTPRVIAIDPGESVGVAARTLAHYNIGVLPVCRADGTLCGVLTDRDIVTRCLAAARQPEQTAVRDVMTRSVVTVPPETETGAAAALMGARQIRRLPVTKDGRLCGMVGLSDLAAHGACAQSAAQALSSITGNVSSR